MCKRDVRGFERSGWMGDEWWGKSKEGVTEKSIGTEKRVGISEARKSSASQSSSGFCGS